MKKIVLLMVCISIMSFESYAQKVKLIPVTTSSARALESYNKAIGFQRDVYMPAYSSAMAEAIKEDPDFFMANFNNAMLGIYFKDEKLFTSSANAALSSKDKLSKGEQLLKEALTRLLADKNADVTEYGRKLVSMYPQDINSYGYLSNFQALNKDVEGAISTIKKSLELNTRKDFMYNHLAYLYMSQGKFDEAEKCLDKYVELSPDLANPYDSRGDLYMQTKQYDKAYSNYTKANEIKPDFSPAKMHKAKSLAENMVIIKEIQSLLEAAKTGHNNLDADMTFRNADNEHFINFISNGKAFNDYTNALNGIRESYSHIKKINMVLTNEDYRVLSPSTVLYTANFSEDIVSITDDDFKTQGVMTIIFEKASDHWNMAYVHQSFLPQQ